MDYSLNLKAFLKGLPLAEMSGHQKFLAMAVRHARGKINSEVTTKDVSSKWGKSLLKVAHNSAFYDRAQREGWVDPVDGKRGTFVVTQPGLDHLEALSALEKSVSAGGLQQAGQLIIVNRKATHTFDKFLRKTLAEAKGQVLVADSWVDETVFDNVLDVIPRTVSVKVIYAQARGAFLPRAKRFATEYPKFVSRRYKALHDRFIIVDEKAYVLGPSIKDAASNSPALIVDLGTREKRLLESFFHQLWGQAQATP
jgi:hypothetical protein